MAARLKKLEPRRVTIGEHRYVLTVSVDLERILAGLDGEWSDQSAAYRAALVQQFATVSVTEEY
jgi:hypothetical protein